MSIQERLQEAGEKLVHTHELVYKLLTALEYHINSQKISDPSQILQEQLLTMFLLQKNILQYVSSDQVITSFDFILDDKFFNIDEFIAMINNIILEEIMYKRQQKEKKETLHFISLYDISILDSYGISQYITNEIVQDVMIISERCDNGKQKDKLPFELIKFGTIYPYFSFTRDKYDGKFLWNW